MHNDLANATQAITARRAVMAFFLGVKEFSIVFLQMEVKKP